MRKFLRDARKAKEMTMQEVADAADIAASTYSMIEHGQRTPSGKVAVRLSRVLDVDMVLFYTDGHAEDTEADAAIC